MLKFSQLQNNFIHYPLNQEEKERELHIMKVMLKKGISTAVRMYKKKGGNSQTTHNKKKFESFCKMGHFHI
jgi:hypothetical protein